jgi:nucleoside-diphosphate-sugar epimerase
MLAKAGHEVVGLDTNLYKGSTFGQVLESVPYTEIHKDIRDINSGDLENFDAIIHLAGLSNDPLGDLNPSLTYEINHQASVKLAKLAKAVGVRRFIFASSCSNYGAGGQDLLDETAPFNPVTPYGKSKVLVEKDVLKYADDHFVPVFLRSATAYGVSPRLRFDLVVNNLVAWAFTTGQVFLKSDGTPWRPLVHVEDMSLAFLAALEAPEDLVNRQAFNVGRTEENYTVRKIAEMVAEEIQGSKVTFAVDAGPDTRNYRVNCDKVILTLPTYKPKWDLRKGIQQLYRSYQKVGIKLDDFEGPRYRRISHIERLIKEGALDINLRWQKGLVQS